MIVVTYADRVHAALGWGREQAVTIVDLARDLDMPVRSVQASVEELRRRGVAICTGSAGVWLTQDPDELLDQYRRLRGRALHQLANLRRMQRTAELMRRPLTMPWAS